MTEKEEHVHRFEPVNGHEYFECEACFETKDFNRHVWDVLSEVRTVVTSLISVGPSDGDTFSSAFSADRAREREKNLWRAQKALERLSELG